VWYVLNCILSLIYLLTFSYFWLVKTWFKWFTIMESSHHRIEMTLSLLHCYTNLTISYINVRYHYSIDKIQYYFIFMFIYIKIILNEFCGTNIQPCYMSTLYTFSFFFFATFHLYVSRHAWIHCGTAVKKCPQFYKLINHNSWFEIDRFILYFH
jgi:hypothetical protein